MAQAGCKLSIAEDDLELLTLLSAVVGVEARTTKPSLCSPSTELLPQLLTPSDPKEKDKFLSERGMSL